MFWTRRQWNPLSMRIQISNKYDVHFNFFLSKSSNEIIYNQTHALNTIEFKDAIVLTESNQYLKRYYFLKNSQDKDQIYDRINLLAEFYAGAVILKYEHPLMILTKTKNIFLKRLKRMKKTLVEEGSSDESKSQSEGKAVSINSSMEFLESVGSIELQRKSVDEQESNSFKIHQLEQSFELYHIYEEPEVEQDQSFGNRLFLSNINKITHLIDRENQKPDATTSEQIKHLVVDFQEFDIEDVKRKYQILVHNQAKHLKIQPKIDSKSSKPFYSSPLQSKQIKVQTLKLRDIGGRKPMASSIMAGSNSNPSEQIQDSKYQSLKFQKTSFEKNNAFELTKKSMIVPKFQNFVERDVGLQNGMKRSSYYQYEVSPEQKQSLFRQQRDIIEEKSEKDDSPVNKFKRNLNSHQYQRQCEQEYQTQIHPNIQKFKLELHGREKQLNKNKKNVLGGFEGKLVNDKQILTHERRMTDRNLQTRYYSPLMKHSSIINSDEFYRQQNRDKRYNFEQVTVNPKRQLEQRMQMGLYHERQAYPSQHVDNFHYDTNNQHRLGSPSAKFYPNQVQPTNRLTSINININNLEEKKQVPNINVKMNPNKISNIQNPLQDFSSNYQESDKQYRAEKKKKIRQKAAQLLNRVKSHEYLRHGYPQQQGLEERYGQKYY